MASYRVCFMNQFARNQTLKAPCVARRHSGNMAWQGADRKPASRRPGLLQFKVTHCQRAEARSTPKPGGMAARSVRRGAYSAAADHSRRPLGV
jgi:hypothetical protein